MTAWLKQIFNKFAKKRIFYLKILSIEKYFCYWWIHLLSINLKILTMILIKNHFTVTKIANFISIFKV